VSPPTPPDHYYESFTIENAALSMREIGVTWLYDLKSINRFEMLPS